MQTDKLKSWLALWRVPQIGCGRFHEIWRTFPDLEEFFHTTPAWRTKNNLPEQLLLDERGIDADLQWLKQNSRHAIITLADETYPKALQEISVPPPILFINGNIELLQATQIAMVGSRNPTAYGVETARHFAKALAKLGFVITSGLAIGIDTISHEGALQGEGKTIAVLGSGMEQIYPKKNHRLALSIVDKEGTLVSEFPIGVPVLPENFPRRNRIISGLSCGVLVIEATQRSGSLITARFANEQGREVFAVPGSIRNPLAQGCHALIKQGAKLVETYQDILEEVAPWLIQNAAALASHNKALTESEPKVKLAKNQQQLLNCINFEPTVIDDLVERSQLNIREVTALLSTLEMYGHVLATAHGYVRTRL